MDTREGNAGIYAHSLPGQPPERWETLDAHASQVARLAREFAEGLYPLQPARPRGARRRRLPPLWLSVGECPGPPGPD